MKLKMQILKMVEWSFLYFLKKNYKINFDKSVSLTKLSKFLFIYSLL